MATISIDGTDYDAYASLDAANTYLAASPSAANWDALSDDGKGQVLVTASRVLDRQNWKGEIAQTSPLQPLAWPRINTGVAGVEDDEIPTDIVNASIEMALALADGTDVVYEQNQAQKIASLKAGSVSLSFFRGAEGQSLRFPLPIQELIKKYLSSQLVVTGVSSGTDGKSVTGDNFGLNRSL